MCHVLCQSLAPFRELGQIYHILGILSFTSIIGFLFHCKVNAFPFVPFFLKQTNLALIPIYQTKKTINNSNGSYLLQLGRLKTSAKLIKLDLLSGNQAFLKSLSDLDSIDGALESGWGRGVVEAGVGKLVGLSDESLSEATVVVRWDLTANTGRLVDVDQVELGLCVDSNLALSAKDLSSVLLAGSHHTGAEELGNLATLYYLC